MPIHWGLFDLPLHAWRQPIERLLELAGEKKIKLWSPEPGRPTEVVGGEFKRLRQAACAREISISRGAQSIPSSQVSAAADRQGSRAAFSPPGGAKGRKVATRSHQPG